MKYGKLIIELREFETLKRIINTVQSRNENLSKDSLAIFSKELKNAKKLSSNDMPTDVVRFNSKVTVQAALGKAQDYTIVMPEKSNISENKISILAPMAMALFGYSKGDEMDWPFPIGMQTIKIIDVKH